MTWGTQQEIERRRRILLTLWAYAYEYENCSLVSDALFDSECALVDLSVPTGRADLDRFFRKEFSPSTGMWVRKHPDLPSVRAYYLRHQKNLK